MAETELEVGNIVQLKTTHVGAQPQFVVSSIIGGEVKVVWFNKDTREFKSDVLPKAVFVKVK